MRSCAQTLAVLSVIAFAIGCGGGASTKPTVTVKPSSKKEGGGDTTAASSGTKKTEGGTAAPAAGGYGSFSGRVVLKGERPEPKLIYKKGDASAKDAAVCAAMDLPDESLVVSEDGGVANVFIYLAKNPAGGKSGPVPEQKLVFDQEYCRFIPHAMAVRVDQTVNVLNSDDVLHNTHNHPNNTTDNPEFNKGLPPKDKSGIPMVYSGNERQPLRVNCDIHSWMSAWHLPLDHGYVAVTDKDGKFEIKDLPAGEHQFIVWHENPKFLNRQLKVTITADQETKQDLPYDLATLQKVAGPEPKVLHLVRK